MLYNSKDNLQNSQAFMQSWNHSAVQVKIANKINPDAVVR